MTCTNLHVIKNAVLKIRVYFYLEILVRGIFKSLYPMLTDNSAKENNL